MDLRTLPRGTLVADRRVLSKSLEAVSLAGTALSNFMAQHPPTEPHVLPPRPDTNAHLTECSPTFSLPRS